MEPLLVPRRVHSHVRIEILRETEQGAGWTFEARATDPRGRAWPFAVRLAWADYNLWCPDGAIAPEAVARAALAFALSREPAAEIESTFDVARLRRRHPDADREIPSLIRP